MLVVKYNLLYYYFIVVIRAIMRVKVTYTMH